MGIKDHLPIPSFGNKIRIKWETWYCIGRNKLQREGWVVICSGRAGMITHWNPGSGFPGSLAVPPVLTTGATEPPPPGCLLLSFLEGRLNLPEPWVFKGFISCSVQEAHCHLLSPQTSSLSLKTKLADSLREMDYSADGEKWSHSC